MKIASVAAHIPEQSTSNHEIEARLGLEPGWIERRTGVRRRPTALPSEATSHFAVRAGSAAIIESGIDAGGIGLLLLATSTPDHLLPPTAPLVAHRLGVHDAGAVDLAGACSGFLYALVLAGHWADAEGKPALVIGANVLTRRVNPMDAATASLFSDGAGAVVVEPYRPSAMIGVHLGSDGSAYDTIGIPAGGSREPLTPESVNQGRNLMTMRRGSSLFKHAVQGMAQAGRKAMEQAGVESPAIDWWIPHQANARILRDVGALLGIPPARTVDIIASHGNSSAATVPIALAEAHTSGRLREGQLLLFTAAGAGLITAGVVLRW